METYQKKALDRTLPVIKEHLHPEDVTQFLIKAGIFSQAELEFLNSPDPREERVEAFVSLLKQKNAFQTFLCSLESAQVYTAIIIQLVNQAEKLKSRKEEAKKGNNLYTEVFRLCDNEISYIGLEFLLQIAENMSRRDAGKLCESIKGSQTKVPQSDIPGVTFMELYQTGDSLNSDDVLRLGNTFHRLGLTTLEEITTRYEKIQNLPDFVIAAEISFLGTKFRTWGFKEDELEVLNNFGKTFGRLLAEEYPGSQFVNISDDPVALTLKFATTDALRKISTDIKSGILSEKLLPILVCQEKWYQENTNDIGTLTLSYEEGSLKCTAEKLQDKEISLIITSIESGLRTAEEEILRIISTATKRNGSFFFHMGEVESLRTAAQRLDSSRHGKNVGRILGSSLSVVGDAGVLAGLLTPVGNTALLVGGMTKTLGSFTSLASGVNGSVKESLVKANVHSTLQKFKIFTENLKFCVNLCSLFVPSQHVIDCIESKRRVLCYNELKEIAGLVKDLTGKLTFLYGFNDREKFKALRNTVTCFRETLHATGLERNVTMKLPEFFLTYQNRSIRYIFRIYSKFGKVVRENECKTKTKKKEKAYKIDQKVHESKSSSCQNDKLPVDKRACNKIHSVKHTTNESEESTLVDTDTLLNINTLTVDDEGNSLEKTLEGRQTEPLFNTVRKISQVGSELPDSGHYPHVFETGAASREIADEPAAHQIPDNDFWGEDGNEFDNDVRVDIRNCDIDTGQDEEFEPNIFDTATGQDPEDDIFDVGTKEEPEEFQTVISNRQYQGQFSPQISNAYQEQEDFTSEIQNVVIGNDHDEYDPDESVFSPGESASEFGGPRVFETNAASPEIANEPAAHQIPDNDFWGEDGNEFDNDYKVEIKNCDIETGQDEEFEPNIFDTATGQDQEEDVFDVSTKEEPEEFQTVISNRQYQGQYSPQISDVGTFEEQQGFQSDVYDVDTGVEEDKFKPDVSDSGTFDKSNDPDHYMTETSNTCQEQEEFVVATGKDHDDYDPNASGISPDENRNDYQTSSADSARSQLNNLKDENKIASDSSDVTANKVTKHDFPQGSNRDTLNNEGGTYASKEAAKTVFKQTARAVSVGLAIYSVVRDSRRLVETVLDVSKGSQSERSNRLRSIADTIEALVLLREGL